MKITALTSLSFLVAGIIKKCPALKLLWVCSTLNHTGHSWIYRIDASLAHAICTYSVLSCPRVINPMTVCFWLSTAYTTGVFKVFRLSYKPGICGDLWHGSIHVVSSIGMVCYSYAQPMPTHMPLFVTLFSGFLIMV